MKPFELMQALKSAIESNEEWDQLSQMAPKYMMKAFRYLNDHGLTPAQVQWLMNCPLSKFTQEQVEDVMILVVAVIRGKTTVAGLHQALRERELWAKMHKSTTLFMTDPLPQVSEIDIALGIKGKIELSMAENNSESLFF